MKKVLVLVFLLVITPIFATPAMASDSVSKIVMPNGITIHESLVKNKEGQVYVNLGVFNNFDYVIALSNFGGTPSWTPEKGHIPSKKTNVALLMQQNNDGTVIMVVNKVTGEVMVESWGVERSVPDTLEVIVEGDEVYLPLQATINLLGATVNMNK